MPSSKFQSFHIFVSSLKLTASSLLAEWSYLQFHGMVMYNLLELAIVFAIYYRCHTLPACCMICLYFLSTIFAAKHYLLDLSWLCINLTFIFVQIKAIRLVHQYIAFSYQSHAIGPVVLREFRIMGCLNNAFRKLFLV